MLIKNELLKMFKQKKTYIFIAFSLVYTLIFVYWAKTDIENTLLADYGNLDGVGQVMPLILLPSISQFVMIFISIYVAGIVTEEIQNGTLFNSLSKPFSRGKILFSKFVAMVFMVIFMYLFYMILTYIVGFTFFEWGDKFVFSDIRYTPEIHLEYTTFKGILTTVQSYGLAILPNIAFGSVALLAAVIIPNFTVAILVPIVLSIVTQYFHMIERFRPFNLVSLSNGGLFHEYFMKPFQTQNIIYSLITITVITIVPLVASHFIFKKKDLVGI